MNITGTDRGNVLVVPIEEGLSSDGILNISASTPNWRQEVKIRRDTIPPRMNSHYCSISESTEEDEEGETSRIQFHMEFSERIYVVVNATCPTSLNHLGPQYNAGASHTVVLWMTVSTYLCCVQLICQMIHGHASLMCAQRSWPMCLK